MNKVMLCGRLIADPKVNRSQGGVCIARYTLAVDRKFKRDGDPTADFIGCVALGKNGEFAEKWLKKGSQILVGGHIQTGSYTNRDGQKVYTTDVLIEEHEFVGSKNSNNAQNNTVPQNTQNFMDIPDVISEEVPFD